MTTLNYSGPKSGISHLILRAIYAGNLEKINELLDSCDPSYLTLWEEGQKLLCDAINYRRLDIAKVLIKRGCQIEDTNNMSLYQDAMSCGDIELVSLLLDKNPKSVNKSHQGDTLLHCAVCDSLKEMVILLLSHGANIDIPNSNGLFPINIAAKRGNVDILKLLLDAGASVESKCDQTGRTNIFYAIESNNKEVVKILVEYGANCNVETYNGKTTLHYAVERRQTEICEILVAAGADLNQRNSVGQTPLHVACMLNDRWLILILLNAGADINATDHNGMVPCNTFQKRIVSSCVFLKSYVSFLLVKQMIIIKECGLYLNSKNMDFLNMFMSTYYGEELHFSEELIISPSEVIKDIISTCQKEINLMKNIKSDSLSCYSVLKKLNNPLSIATEAEINLLQLALTENELNLYEVILKTKLKYATIRNNLLKQAQLSFSVVINGSENKLPPIPEEMNRCIVSYLNNDELGLFIKNVNKL